MKPIVEAAIHPSTRIYLDVCALSRPFDDQSYLRIRLETEAVNMILSKIKKGSYRLMFSPAHLMEIEAIPDVSEQIELLAIIHGLGERIKVDMAQTRTRADELIKLHFGVADAAHVAFAEQCMALTILEEEPIEAKPLSRFKGIFKKKINGL